MLANLPEDVADAVERARAAATAARGAAERARAVAAAAADASEAAHQGRAGAVLRSWEDGRRYSGMSEGERLTGVGFISAPGAEGGETVSFFGEIVDGVAVGLGVTRWGPGEADARSQYEGEHRDGGFSGLGAARYANGLVYAGEWAGSQPHGVGVLHDPSGARYEGAWENGARSGLGLLVGPDGVRHEFGVFAADALAEDRSGRGVLFKDHPDNR
jgi:hypothetical protein